jgi:energy-converting hydrogenase Eha subunit F
VSVYLNTRGKTTLAIGICGRCSRKFSLDDLYPDPNYPGLRVCRVDMDEYDPYRLPARQPEVISLQYPRPDTPIGTDPLGLPTEDDSYFLTTEDSDFYLEP